MGWKIKLIAALIAVATLVQGTRGYLTTTNKEIIAQGGVDQVMNWLASLGISIALLSFGMALVVLIIRDWRD
jgi:formate hydrogenlyase subunit 3/multisubunit Na+/H+ antiporter MnhD subunit